MVLEVDNPLKGEDIVSTVQKYTAVHKSYFFENGLSVTNLNEDNCLQYSNKLFLTRAANLNGSALPISGIVLTDDIIADLTDKVSVGSTEGLEVGQWISFGGSDTQFKFYEIKNIVANTSITVDRLIEDDLVIGETVNAFSITTNGEVEASKVGGVDITDSTAYIGKMTTIGNEEDFEMKESSIAFVSTDSKFKFIARTPGKWSDKLEVAIANPASFGASTPVQAFDGIFLDDLFEYAPTGNQLGIIVRYNDEIKEIFTVSTDVNAKDNNNKSTYIETVINSQSNYIYVKDNVTVSDVKDYTFTAGKLLTFVNGKDSDIGNDDLLNAYELWSNKEEVDIDIIIANELDFGISAKALAETRKDCIAFVGANYSDVVGKKSSDAVTNLVNWRKTGELNWNSMFAVACANYVYIYDRFNDKNR